MENELIKIKTQIYIADTDETVKVNRDKDSAYQSPYQSPILPSNKGKFEMFKQAVFVNNILVKTLRRRN